MQKFLTPSICEFTLWHTLHDVFVSCNQYVPSKVYLNNETCSMYHFFVMQHALGVFAW